jgi:hypothetical protein
LLLVDIPDMFCCYANPPFFLVLYMTVAVFHCNVLCVIQYWVTGHYYVVTPFVSVMDIRSKFWDNETADSKSQFAFVRGNKFVAIYIWNVYTLLLIYKEEYFFSFPLQNPVVKCSWFNCSYIGYVTDSNCLNFVEICTNSMPPKGNPGTF